jgi:hypothetical protein
MTTSRTDDLLAILQGHFKPRENGWLWLATDFDGDERGIVHEITGAYEDPVAAAYGVGRIVDACTPDHAYIALCRSEGRPTESDREMWRVLRGLVSAETLTDMVVFNRRQAWSMRAEDTAAA